MDDTALRAALDRASPATLQSLHCLLRVVAQDLDIIDIEPICVHCDRRNFSCKLITKLTSAPTSNSVHKSSDLNLRCFDGCACFRKAAKRSTVAAITSKSSSGNASIIWHVRCKASRRVCGLRFTVNVT